MNRDFELEEQIEASKRFITTEKRLLDSLDIAHMKDMEMYARKRKSLLENIEKESNTLRRKEALCPSR